MKVIQTNKFKKAVKKLHKNQKKDLDIAISNIIQNYSIGATKKGDLSDVYIYKFKMVGQLTLIAYIYEDKKITLTLMNLGSHENFYRDLKS